MKPLLFVLLLFLLATVSSVTLAQRRPPAEEHPRLPDGRSQTEEILKADHEKTLRDAADLLKLAEDLKIELEKNDRHVVSMGMVKKTEEIEKIAKRIRSRLKRG